jgi:hypothetical protein
MLAAMKDLLAWSQHVASWRREVHAIYADVRAADEPATAHARWVERRTELFVTHPATARQEGQVLRHGPYDPAYRFVLPIEAAEPEEWEPTTGSDGAVPFRRAGRFEIPGIGGLDVWWLGSYGNGIFVPLRDATAGRTTYGAGRYLLDTVKGADLGLPARAGGQSPRGRGAGRRAQPGRRLTPRSTTYAANAVTSAPRSARSSYWAPKAPTRTHSDSRSTRCHCSG